VPSDALRSSLASNAFPTVFVEDENQHDALQIIFKECLQMKYLQFLSNKDSGVHDGGDLFPFVNV